MANKKNNSGVAAVLAHLKATGSGDSKVKLIQDLLGDSDVEPASSPSSDAYEGALGAANALSEGGFPGSSKKALTVAESLKPKKYTPSDDDDDDEGDDPPADEPPADDPPTGDDPVVFPESWKKADYVEACEKASLEVPADATIADMKALLGG